MAELIVVMHCGVTVSLPFALAVEVTWEDQQRKGTGMDIQYLTKRPTMYSKGLLAMLSEGGPGCLVWPLCEPLW